MAQAMTEGLFGAEVSCYNPSVSSADSSLYTREPDRRHYRQMVQYLLGHVILRHLRSPTSGAVCRRQAARTGIGGGFRLRDRFCSTAADPLRARQAARAPTRGAKSAQPPKTKRKRARSFRTTSSVSDYGFPRNSDGAIAQLNFVKYREEGRKQACHTRNITSYRSAVFTLPAYPDNDRRQVRRQRRPKRQW